MRTQTFCQRSKFPLPWCSHAAFGVHGVERSTPYFQEVLGVPLARQHLLVWRGEPRGREARPRNPLAEQHEVAQRREVGLLGEVEGVAPRGARLVKDVQRSEARLQP